MSRPLPNWTVRFMPMWLFGRLWPQGWLPTHWPPPTTRRCALVGCALGPTEDSGEWQHRRCRRCPQVMFRWAGDDPPSNCRTSIGEDA